MTTLLFFDDWPLEARHNVDRRLGKPQWVPEGTLEDDLTKGIYNFPSVFRDPDNGKWYLLYQGVVGASEELTSTHVEIPVLMLAESMDGIQWTKPDLRSRTGQTAALAPNQVLKDDDVYDRGPIFFDPKPSDPNERLKAMAVYESEGARGERVFRQCLASSADGIRWAIKDRVWNNWLCSDSPYPIFWNEGRGVYTIITRPQQAERRVVRIDTMDFLTFDGPYDVLSPDPLDPPMVQFYGMPVFPYEDVFVGLLWLMYGDPYEVQLLKRNGPIDAQLTYSYDGIAFNRTFRQPFLGRNSRGEEGGGCIYPSALAQDDDGNILIYSGSSHGEHYKDTDQVEAAIVVHKLRRDGFMYLESHSNRGRIMTRSLRLGERLDLTLNVRAPYGWVRAQLSDIEGRPFEGYTFEECEPFRGDNHLWEPIWDGASRAPWQQSGGVGRIEVELTNAELYAIRGNFEWLGIAKARGFLPDPSQPEAVEAWHRLGGEQRA